MTSYEDGVALKIVEMRQAETSLRDKLQAWQQRGKDLATARQVHSRSLARIVEDAEEQGFNRSEVARELGISRQALSKRLGKVE